MSDESRSGSPTPFVRWGLIAAAGVLAVIAGSWLARLAAVVALVLASTQFGEVPSPVFRRRIRVGDTSEGRTDSGAPATSVDVVSDAAGWEQLARTAAQRAAEWRRLYTDLRARLDGNDSALDSGGAPDNGDARLDGAGARLDGAGARLDGAGARLDGAGARLDNGDARLDDNSSWESAEPSDTRPIAAPVGASELRQLQELLHVSRVRPLLSSERDRLGELATELARLPDARDQRLADVLDYARFVAEHR